MWDLSGSAIGNYRLFPARLIGRLYTPHLTWCTVAALQVLKRAEVSWGIQLWTGDGLYIWTLITFHFLFNRRIVNLQCCVSFWMYNKVIQLNTFVFIFFFHYSLLKDIKYSSLYYIVSPCWLSILYIFTGYFLITHPHHLWEKGNNTVIQCHDFLKSVLKQYKSFPAIPYIVFC